MVQAITTIDGMPAIPDVIVEDKNLQVMLDSMKEAIEVLTGTRGNPLSRALTYGEASEGGLTDLFVTNRVVDTAQGSQDSVTLIGDITGVGLFTDQGAVTVNNVIALPNVVCIDGGDATETFPGAATGPYGVAVSGITVQEEGVDLTAFGTTLNFVGAGVTASGTGSVKTITISGGGGGTIGGSITNDQIAVGATAADDIEGSSALTFSAGVFDVQGNITLTGVLTVNDITALDTIQWNTALTKPAHTEGLLFYDKDEHTMAVYNDEAEVTHQLGQEGYIRVYNNSGGTILNGQVVTASGEEGVEGRPTVALARSDVQSTSEVLGVATHDIENNTFGYITYWGIVNDVDTSAFNSGDVLHLSASTAGAVTKQEPAQGTYWVQVGYVGRVNATTGSIVVDLSADLSGFFGEARRTIANALKGSPGTINPGQVVYITGWNISNEVVEVELADASASATMPAMGVSRDTITNTGIGEIVVQGELFDVVDTSTYTIGDQLYVSETTGALTNVKPTGTALVQKIAIVARSHASSGVVEVVGAGRSNDLPNLPTDNVWLGNGSAVPTATLLNLAAITDVTATAAEVNLLDLAALTAGDVLVAATASTAAWRQLVEADISDFGSYSVTGHTHTLSQVTDVTATVAEVNLLDLAGLTAGWVLSADTATTASWKAPTGGGTIGGSITDNQVAVGATTADDIEGSVALTFNSATGTLSFNSDMFFSHDGANGLWQNDTGTMGIQNRVNNGLINLGADTSGGTFRNILALRADTSEYKAAANTIFDLQQLGMTIQEGLRIVERADHRFTPAATYGEIWISNGATQALMFTDDAGTDYDLTAGGGGIGGSITDNQIAVGATTADDIEGTSGLTFNSATNLLKVEGNVARIDTNHSSATLDQGYWRKAWSETEVWTIFDDALSNSYEWFRAERSGTGASVQIDTIDFTAETDITLNSAVIVTGSLTATGEVLATVDSTSLVEPLVGQNTTAGVAAAAQLTIKADAGETNLRHNSSTFTTAGAYRQDGAILMSGSTSSGGLTLASTGAATNMEFYAGGTATGNLALTLSGSNQNATFAGTVDVSGANIKLTNAGNPYIDITDSGSSSTLRMAAEGATLVMGSETAHNLVIQSNATIALTIDTSQNAAFAGEVSATALTVGSTVATAPELSLYGNSTSDSTINFKQFNIIEITRATIEWNHTLTDLVYDTTGATYLHRFRINSNDKFQITNNGAFIADGGLLFEERADHAFTPTVSRGELWVRNDTLQSLVFTDDAGTDRVVATRDAAGDLPLGDGDRLEWGDFAEYIRGNNTGSIEFFTDSALRLTVESEGIEVGGGARLAERADHAYTPAATWGEVWLKNGATQALMFTDDAGTDYDLTAGGGVVQTVNVTDGAYATGATAIPDDDTIPQITEGAQFMTASITPTNTANTLKVEVVINASIGSTGGVRLDAALFNTDQHATNAIAAGRVWMATANVMNQIVLTAFVTADVVTSSTFTVRVGTGAAANVYFNGQSAARKLGGAMSSSITITELKA